MLIKGRKICNKERMSEVKNSKLSREILGLFGLITVIAVFFYFFLSTTADSLVQSYCYRREILLTEMQSGMLYSWINSISFFAAAVVFLILFFFFAGQKIGYIHKIIQGVHALRMHRMEYEIVIEGDNELTELAESINYLVRTERELKAKEEALKEEKDALIRALSHDIRTPLTTILSYSEWISGKDTVSREELLDYAELMRQKAEQIKSLTDRLLDGDRRSVEWVENGRFLMEQLADEWVDGLEDAFICRISWSGCRDFSGEFDITELQRIFDNLSSNVKKYADSLGAVELDIFTEGEMLILRQKNMKRHYERSRDICIESFGIGLESVRRIAERYSGGVEVQEDEEVFQIRVSLKVSV